MLPMSVPPLTLPADLTGRSRAVPFDFEPAVPAFRFFATLTSPRRPVEPPSRAQG